MICLDDGNLILNTTGELPIYSAKIISKIQEAANNLK